MKRGGGELNQGCASCSVPHEVMMHSDGNAPGEGECTLPDASIASAFVLLSCI